MAQCRRPDIAESQAATKSGRGATGSTRGAPGIGDMFAALAEGFAAATAFPHPTVEVPPSKADIGKNNPTTPATSTAAPTVTFRNRDFNWPPLTFRRCGLTG
jgi:hypothetical protein